VIERLIPKGIGTSQTCASKIGTSEATVLPQRGGRPDLQPSRKCLGVPKAWLDGTRYRTHAFLLSSFQLVPERRRAFKRIQSLEYGTVCLWDLGELCHVAALHFQCTRMQSWKSPRSRYCTSADPRRCTAYLRNTTTRYYDQHEILACP
jgi:hypothetical protein